MGIQDQGFGLNYNQGFGKGGGIGNNAGAELVKDSTLGAQGFLNQSELQKKQLDAQKYGIDQNNATQRYGYDSQTRQAQIGADTQRYGYDTAAGTARLQDATNRYGISSTADTNRYQADTQRYGYDQQLRQAQLADSTNRYGIDSQYRQAQLQADTSRYGADQNTRQAQIAADASKYPAMLKQQRFDQLFPFLSQGLQGAANGGGSPSTAQGQQPRIDANPVYSEQLIQQNVNSQRAQNDAQTAGQVRQMQQQLGGRGYGASSPLAMALAQGYQAQNMGTNAGVETQTRLGAATANSQQVLAGQQAQEAQFASRQGEGIERDKVNASRYNALLSALGGIA